MPRSKMPTENGCTPVSELRSKPAARDSRFSGLDVHANCEDFVIPITVVIPTVLFSSKLVIEDVCACWGKAWQKTTQQSTAREKRRKRGGQQVPNCDQPNTSLGEDMSLDV